MAKQLVCADLGMKCAAVLTADTNEELMGKAAGHFKEVHDIDPVPPETAEMATSLIRDI